MQGNLNIKCFSHAPKLPILSTEPRNCYIFIFKNIKCCHTLFQNNEGPRQDKGFGELSGPLGQGDQIASRSKERSVI